MTHTKTVFLLLVLGFSHIHAERNLLQISFDAGMEPIGRYMKHNVIKNSFWRKVKELYTQHIVDDLQYSSTTRIPKIIHHIWLGSPFPQKYAQWRETWFEKHPDWKHILWTDKDIESLNLVNKKMYDKASNYGEKSDIARYEILYRFGGLYVDTDFECLKSFDDLHHCCNFYSGVDEGPTAMFNGLIASVPGHPLLLACIENMRRGEKETDSTNAIVHRTGPQYFTRILREHLSQNTDLTVFFPTTFFYPWPWFKRFENKPEQIKKWIRPETLAIHHWEVSWNGGK